MLWPWHLRRAAWLLSLCLLTQCRLHTAAGSLTLGEEAHTFPKAQNGPANEVQVHSLPETGPGAETRQGSEDDLFQDVDPKALAAVLLQALRTEPEKPNNRRRDPEQPNANEERVQSKTKSSDVEPEREQGWKVSKDQVQPPQEEEENPDEQSFEQQEVERLKALLEELQHYSPAAKRQEPSQDHDDVLEEDEQLRVNTKRKAPPSEPWVGARKLRQQQHLEHQLLQRRYEELAESRRQAEEARRAAAEEERLADMASDLLLQYLLKDGEDAEEEHQGASAREESEEDGGKGSSLLFEDEESNVAEDKRSNEAPEEEDDDIDPKTIDRLIELSSKLHLPADDVIDIINDVEEEKKKKDMPEPSNKSKTLATPPRDKPKKAPSSYHQDPRPVQKQYRPPTYQHLPKEDEAAWNEVLRGDEDPAPKWYRVKSNNKISNYISPRTFQPLVYHRFRQLPGPMVPRDEYYDDSRAHDEELENYIERVLMERPKVFQ